MLNRIDSQLDLFDSQNLSLEKSKEKDLSFKSLLNKKVQQVNDLQNKSDKLTRNFTLGKTDNIHSVMIASEKAEIALNMTVAIQNKIIDAYKEIMRIQV